MVFPLVSPPEWFVMHYNQLTGTIPEDLSLGLNVVFDISHNRFIGTIPENFATADGIVPNVRYVCVCACDALHTFDDVKPSI